MSPKKRNREENDSNDLMRSLQDIRDEIRKMQRKNNDTDEATEEVGVEITENDDIEKRLNRLQEKLDATAAALEEVQDFVFQNATGARPFIHQQKIMEAMLTFGSPDKWKGKAPRDLASELTTVQRALNEKKEFAAANELQGLVEVAETAREIIMLNPSAASWIKKALDEAIGTVLCQGKEKRGQAILWTCLQRQLIEKVAEHERQGSTKVKSTSSSSGQAELPCRNCIKNGLQNQMHTVAECAKRRNSCRIECAFCQQDPATKEFPCHWRDNCPTLRKWERESASRNFGFNR